MKRLNKRKLVYTLRRCVKILHDIEHAGVALPRDLVRGIVEYRYNAEAALKIPHRR